MVVVVLWDALLAQSMLHHLPLLPTYASHAGCAKATKQCGSSNECCVGLVCGTSGTCTSRWLSTGVAAGTLGLALTEQQPGSQAERV